MDSSQEKKNIFKMQVMSHSMFYNLMSNRNNFVEIIFNNFILK